jgi:hypothetical protein
MIRGLASGAQMLSKQHTASEPQSSGPMAVQVAAPLHRPPAAMHAPVPDASIAASRAASSRVASPLQPRATVPKSKNDARKKTPIDPEDSAALPLEIRRVSFF